MYLFVHSALSPARAASQADLTANHPGLRSAGIAPRLRRSDGKASGASFHWSTCTSA